MIWKFLKQNVLFPKGLNWVQHWVSRIGLWTLNCSIYSFFQWFFMSDPYLTDFNCYLRTWGSLFTSETWSSERGCCRAFRTSSLARSLRDLMPWSSLRSLLWETTCSKSTFLIAKIITLSLPQSKWASSSSVSNLRFWRFTVHTSKK